MALRSCRIISLNKIYDVFDMDRQKRSTDDLHDDGAMFSDLARQFIPAPTQTQAVGTPHPLAPPDHPGMQQSFYTDYIYL